MSKPTVRWREESFERDRERLRNQSALNRLTSRDREPKQAPVRRGYDPRSEDERERGDFPCRW
jgi:hypothetical protein